MSKIRLGRAVCLALPLFVGCAVDGAPPSVLEDEVTAGKADTFGVEPGTYVSHGLATEDALLDDTTVWLTLMSDGSYRREVEGDEETSGSLSRGTYEVTRRREKLYLTLTDQTDEATRYEVMLSGHGLHLRFEGGLWDLHARSGETRCDTANECSLQGDFPTVACVGVSSCAANACAFSCENRTVDWLEAAKAEYLEHDISRMEKIELTDLPRTAASKAEYDASVWDYTPEAYKGTVAGRVTYIVVLEHDGGMFADLYDSSGAHFAEGGASESGTFSWKGDAADAGPLLTCTGVRRDEATTRGPIEIFDLGPATDVPEGLPSTLSSVVSGGLPVRQYRVTGEIKVGRAAYQSIDESYYGNLYQGDGVIVSENDTVYEISGTDEGLRMTVRISRSPATDIGLKLECEGTLPTEAEARGPDPLGLALRFDCATSAVPQMRATRFSFGLIRIDRLESIGMMDGEDEDEPDTVVTVSDRSPVYSLNENWGLHRNTRSIYVSGDSDGFAYSELRISIPREAGQEVSGTFEYESDGEPKWRAPVTCTTREP